MPKTQNQAEIFSSQWQCIDLPGADIRYFPAFFSEAESATLFNRLLSATEWRQEKITLFGTTHKVPRLSCWMADAGLAYRYSNMTMHPVAWSPLLRAINRQVSEATGCDFNSVLINYYRDGRDSNGWHSDDEPELGDQPSIASVSLGGTRDFLMRHKDDHKLKFRIALQPGSLLLMSGSTQRCWQHSIPKRAHADARINLTFRTVISRVKNT